MKLFIKTVGILSVALLLSGYPGMWEDQVKQVGKSTVKILSVGSDTHWISNVDRIEALKLGEFIETYNDIAYKKNVSQDALCQELKEAAVVAIESRIKSFYGLYEVNCLQAGSGKAPGLEIYIWTQNFYGYRFKLSFEPSQ